MGGCGSLHQVHISSCLSPPSILSKIPNRPRCHKLLGPKHSHLPVGWRQTPPRPNTSSALSLSFSHGAKSRCQSKPMFPRWSQKCRIENASLLRHIRRGRERVACRAYASSEALLSLVRSLPRSSFSYHFPIFGLILLSVSLFLAQPKSLASPTAVFFRSNLLLCGGFVSSENKKDSLLRPWPHDGKQDYKPPMSNNEKK